MLIGVSISALLYPAAQARASAPVFGYQVLHVYPHDAAAYTQGLIFADSVLFEGTGLYGESSLRKVEVETGAILKQYDLPPQYFGEGITALRDTLYQLTWINHQGFAYVERDTFELIQAFPYPWEGWGLTHDETHLIASDGSATIRFLDPRTREEISRIQVNDDGAPVRYLNELEYIQGRIYSNVYGSDRIAVIDPTSGRVEAWLHLGGLRDSVSYYPSAGVLNGIAFVPEDLRLFVTGKLWPKLFQIDVAPLHPTGVEDVATFPRAGPPVLRSVPNPCTQGTRLTFAAPGDAPVSLRVFDLRGRLVRALVRGRLGAGDHDVTLDVSGLPSGAYIVWLVSGEVTESRKVLVVR